MQEKLYKSKNLADELKVGRGAIRSWELSGLLKPDYVAGDSKLYNNESLEKARHIRDLFKAGRKTEDLLELDKQGKL